MNERVVVAQAAATHLASLAQPRSLKVTKPQSDQSIVLDLSDHGAKIDFSAVADEKMTLVHVGTKLIILFDNQSTVTADPFFDFSGKPLANLDVELGAGRAVNGEQFAQLFSVTEDQSALRTAGNIPPSAANFHDPSIDALGGGPRPLALLEQELGARIGVGADLGAGDGDTASFTHNSQTLSPTPTISVPPAGGPSTNVFEGGLGTRPGEPPGTHAGQASFPITTRPGTIGFTSSGRSLSGGQKQAIGLARALIRKPQILFLDEPTAHFDTRSEAEFLDRLSVLADSDMTIIVSTHRLSLLALVDRLLVFEQGLLIADGPRDQILAKLQALAQGPISQPQAQAKRNAAV
jgi:hypothetical protein